MNIYETEILTAQSERDLNRIIAKLADDLKLAPDVLTDLAGLVLTRTLELTPHSFSASMRGMLKIPHQPVPPQGAGETVRLFLTTEQRRAWNWAAAKAGVHINEFARHGGDELLRRFVASAVADGVNPPQDVAEFLARAAQSNEGKP